MQGAVAPRVNIEDQRNKEIADRTKFGAVKRQLHFYSDSDRNIKGLKLPEHKLPSTSSKYLQSDACYIVTTFNFFHSLFMKADDETQFLSNELKKQKRLDILRKQLREALILYRGNTHDSDNVQLEQ